MCIRDSCYTFLPAIDWLASGAIDISPLVSHVAPMQDFASVFHPVSYTHLDVYKRQPLMLTTMKLGPGVLMLSC